MIERISENQVDEAVQRDDQPVVLDFWMDNCPPCNMLAPKLKATAEAFEGRVQVYQVKVDEQSPVLKQYDVKGMPTVLLFKGGELVDHLGGLIRREDLQEAFEDVASET